MILKYNDFLNEKHGSNDKTRLAYCIYDIDDNLLFMKSVIHMDHKEGNEWVPEDVSTEKFAKIRGDKENYRFRNDDADQAFSEFRDSGPRGDDTFIEDVKTAVNEKSFGPSWKSFIDCLINGNIFGIITSRGHSPENMKKTVEWIIYEYLPKHKQSEMTNNLLSYHGLFGTDVDYVIDQYLDACFFIGCSSKWFEKEFGKDAVMDERKRIAMRYIMTMLNKYGKKIDANIKLSFSDDDPKFVDAITNLMRDELSLKFLNTKFYVFDTSKKGIKKIKI